MAVLIPGKLIFLEHPRTASTSVREALKKQAGGRTKSRHTLFLPERGEKIACTVRNPYDVLVSWWLIIGERQGFTSFNDFLARCGDKFMVKRGNLFYFAHHADYILHFESLQKDMTMLCNTIGLPLVVLPHLNGTAKKLTYHSYYNEEAIALVQDRFGAELKAFNYEFGP